MLFSLQSAILATIFGVVLGLIGVLYAAIRLRNTDSKAGLISIVIALAGCVAIFIGMAINSLLDLGEPRLIAVTLAFGVITILLGLILVRREHHSASFTASRSFGWLYAGVGVFAVICAVMLPIIPPQWSAAAPTAIPTASATLTRTLAATRTPRPQATLTATDVPTLTNTPTLIPTLTVTPTFSLPELPTRIIPTDTLTPTTLAVPDCKIRVASNVNLRDTPSARGKLITTLKTFTILPALGQLADKSWWKVIFDNQPAWVSDQYVTIPPNSNCSAVPTIAP